MNGTAAAVVLAVALAAGGSGPVKITRVHEKGQKYKISYSNADPSLGITTTFKAEATATDVKGAETVFAVAFSEIRVEETGRAPQTYTGVKARVTVGDSVDAEVTDPGTGGGKIELLYLTAFEMLMGDFCQPPAVALKPGATHQDWKLTGVEKGVASFVSEPKGQDPFHCNVKVSTADGFAGTRSSVMKLNLKKDMVIEQKLQLDVQKL
jgi:hypothetical protein